MSNVKLPVLDTGVPGVTGPAPTDFNSFYVFYLTQHLHPRTRLSHVIGMTLGWLADVAAVRAALGLRADQIILADAPELSPPNRHLTAAGGNSL
jgi:hypothetical protein